MKHHSDRFKLIAAVHLFLIKDNNVLLARRFQTGYEDGKYSVPAGHVDGEETARHAMVREAQEEVGVTIVEQDLEFAHVMHRNTNRESMDLFFTCSKWSGDPKIGEPEKCDHIEWFARDALPENIIPYIKQALELHTTGVRYSELGW